MNCCDALRDRLDPDFFKALCDPTRLLILSRLAGECEPKNIGQLSDGLPVDRSVVSRHLSVLRDAGFLNDEKCGKERRFSINIKFFIGSLRSLADAVEQCCVPPLARRTKDAKKKKGRIKRNG